MDFQRFLNAQGPVIDTVVAELRSGRKRTHWMWFIFPQLASLGRSSTARYYGIESVEEARAYLAHPVLRERLHRCTRAVLGREDAGADAIFGSTDALKFRSSMTLFGLADPGEPMFRDALAKFYAGRPDPLTIAYCKGAARGAGNREGVD